MRRAACFPNAPRRHCTTQERCIPVLAAVTLLITIAGCVATPPSPTEPPQVVLPEAESEPAPPAPAVEAEPPSAPVPMPMPGISNAATTMTFDAKAAVILSDRSPSYENVAAELNNLLVESVVYNLADRSQSHEEVFAAVAESDAAVVIAIGLSAAQAAAKLSSVPVVYCQVFNFRRTEGVRIPVKGVATIPPLSLQIAAWKEIDPELRDVGAILGVGHDGLIAEAAGAAAANGVAFHYRIAGSDRETLYSFKRMAPEIDGFWLFPDNRVLSVPVLKEIVDIAARHDVRIAVFNDALLELGVEISTSALDADIAAAVIAVAGKVTGGAADLVPDVTPLSDLNLRAGAKNYVLTGTLAPRPDKAGGGYPRGRP